MIFGRVTDPQGAAVPAVDVLIVNVDTNALKKAVSNESGYFEMPLLDPGNYSVTVEKTGFRKFVRSGIELNVNSRASIDVTLQLGSVSEVVEVVEQAPLLETSSASAGRVVDNRQIMELPYSDLNPYVLAGLAPGMQWTGAPDANRTLWSGGGTSSFNTAGGVGMNEYTIDGAPNTGSSKRVAFIAPSDAVGEFRLETANFDASFGHTSGATVNLSTKSGTNKFHGTVYDQHWQQRWNATQHFARLAWEDSVAKGKTSPDSQKQQSGRSNSPGASIGGPVIIPKLFNGRDKLFFFFNYGGVFQNTTDQPDRLPRTVPKEAWRKGDFSDLLALDATLYQIYDPLSARQVGNRVVRTPFPENKGIPIMNPMYSFYEKIYPLPNNVSGLVTPEGFNNYFAANMPKIDRHNGLLNRIDWEASPRHKFFGRWYWNNRHANTSDWTYADGPGPAFERHQPHQQGRGRGLGVDHQQRDRAERDRRLQPLQGMGRGGRAQALQAQRRGPAGLPGPARRELRHPAHHRLRQNAGRELRRAHRDRRFHRHPEGATAADAGQPQPEGGLRHTQVLPLQDGRGLLFGPVLLPQHLHAPGERYHHGRQPGSGVGGLHDGHPHQHYARHQRLVLPGQPLHGALPAGRLPRQQPAAAQPRAAVRV